MSKETKRMTRKFNLFAVLLVALAALLPAGAQAAAPFGIEKFGGGAFQEGGGEELTAGAHPFNAVVEFDLDFVGETFNRKPLGTLKDVDLHLPSGLIGNPQAVPMCAAAGAPNPFNNRTLCPADTQVGVAEVRTNFGSTYLPIFNVKPPPGQPALLMFAPNNVPIMIGGAVRPSDDYRISTLAPYAPSTLVILGVKVTIWGVPADPAHDQDRGRSEGGGVWGGICAAPDVACSNPGATTVKPFFSLPTSCTGQPVQTDVRITVWEGEDDSAAFTTPSNTDCDGLEFEPTLKAQPTTDNADSPSGLDVELTVPQNEDPDERATAHLKDSVVTLPPGMTVNPASAHGLQGCAPTQIDLDGDGAAQCPEASKLGTVSIETPLLDHPVAGSVFLASPHNNPFDSLLALYIAVDDQESGIVVKLAGEVETNPATGQVTARFDENPQLPFERLKLHFFGGDRGSLRTPDTCGEHTTNALLTPWSAPQSGPPAQAASNLYIGKGAGGVASCAATKAARPFEPTLEAGTTNPLAGAHSSFTLRITRPDGNQELSSISLATPPGFAATLKGVPVCPDVQVAQAIAQTGFGDGAAELASPSCPASSQVGTTTIGVGAGANPYYVKTGKVYRTGPYKGAQQSLTFIVPAVAGPFDLGVQVVRTALRVNPITAQITAESDPIPQILAGIPLAVRDVRVDIDRPGFALNPTNCEELAVTAQVGGGSGAVKTLSNRFQVDGCRNLGFKPKLQLTYKGQTKRTGNPGLRAVLTQPEGQANISRTVVLLPLGSLIDNAHINNPCTRAQYAANECPASSILGTATAWSPLLDQPLSGNVYFRSNGGERELPDVVAALKGEVDVELVGFVDAVQNKKAGTSRVRNTFAVVPDAPVSKFELNLKGGKVGLIENSKNLCKQVNRATVKMSAHNGRALTANPAVKTSCPKKKKSKKKR